MKKKDKNRLADIVNEKKMRTDWQKWQRKETIRMAARVKVKDDRTRTDCRNL